MNSILLIVNSEAQSRGIVQGIAGITHNVTCNLQNSVHNQRVFDLASHYHHLHVAHNSTDINFKAWSYGVGQGGYTFLIKLHNDVSHKCAHVHDVYGLLKLGHQEELRIKRAVHRYLILPDVQESSLTVSEIQKAL